MSKLGIFLTASALALFGCGSDDSGSDGAGGKGGGGTGGVVGGGLSAPVLTDVMPMPPAGIHVTWQNVQSGCDTISGERKTSTSDFAEVFSVPGDVDNKHDGTATEKVSHTYRVRCKKGESYSPYSNEMSATPL